MCAQQVRCDGLSGARIQRSGGSQGGGARTLQHYNHSGSELQRGPGSPDRKGVCTCVHACVHACEGGRHICRCTGVALPWLGADADIRVACRPFKYITLKSEPAPLSSSQLTAGAAASQRVKALPALLWGRLLQERTAQGGSDQSSPHSARGATAPRAVRHPPSVPSGGGPFSAGVWWVCGGRGGRGGQPLPGPVCAGGTHQPMFSYPHSRTCCVCAPTTTITRTQAPRIPAHISSL